MRRQQKEGAAFCMLIHVNQPRKTLLTQTAHKGLNAHQTALQSRLCLCMLVLFAYICIERSGLCHGFMQNALFRGVSLQKKKHPMH